VDERQGRGSRRAACAIVLEAQRRAVRRQRSGESVAGRERGLDVPAGARAAQRLLEQHIALGRGQPGGRGGAREPFDERPDLGARRLEQDRPQQVAARARAAATSASLGRVEVCAARAGHGDQGNGSASWRGILAAGNAVLANRASSLCRVRSDP
jgi:hypothetical protein